MNEKKLFNIISEFNNKIKNEDFVIDKSGVKLVEVIGCKLELDPIQSELNFFNIKKTNVEYCKKELNWYNSMSLSIKNHVDDITIWRNVCDENKNVNSNYGWCIYSKENSYQYKNCIDELRKNKESRRAIMIYLRPSMWLEYNYNGMNDFICTISSQYFIRNNSLINVVNQRSCDFIYGFFNDFYWHCEVYKNVTNNLNKYNLQNGNIIYFFNTLHVYEKHFETIKRISEKIENICL